MSTTFYIDQPDTLIISMIKEDRGYEWVDNINDADFLVFTGGADIDPDIYDERPHPKTGPISRVRDDKCKSMVRHAMKLSFCGDRLPMVGICRGAQFLCAMAGNRLWQDVTGHAIGHTHRALDLQDYEWVDVTSTHHQMMRLVPDTGSRVLMEAHVPSCYRSHWSEKYGWLHSLSDEPQIEAMLHPHMGALSYQPHPEYTPKGSDCRAKFWQYFDTMMTEWGGDNV